MASVHLPSLLGQGFSFSSCVPCLGFLSAGTRHHQSQQVKSPKPPPRSLHPHKRLNIVAWKLCHGTEVRRGAWPQASQHIPRKSVTAGHNIGPIFFEPHSYRFGFCGPPCLKWTILEWSTKTSEFIFLGGSNPLGGWQLQRSSLI